MKWKNEIVQGDSIELMKELEDDSVELILTDPPYGVDLDYDEYDDSLDNWKKLFKTIVPEFKRIAQMAIFPSCQIKQMEFIYRTHPPDWLICWYKGSPGQVSYIGFNDWEPLLVYGKTDGICMHDYFYAKPTDSGIDHPCPKSVEWAEWLIERATDEGDTVLDPFLGSGTVAVACKKLNRNYIGIELSEEYCELARDRVEKVSNSNLNNFE